MVLAVLLVAELVAGECENLQATRPETLRQLIELMVVPGRRASERCNVDNQANLPAVFLHLRFLSIQSVC